jgi:membrane-associated phospholipid phosphatase
MRGASTATERRDAPGSRTATQERDASARGAGWHPAVVFTVSLVAGYLVLAAVAIGFGLLLVHVLLPFHGLGSADEHVNEVLARHRSSGLNEATSIGSAIGDVPAIPALVTLVVLLAAAFRRWRVAGFVLGAILVEVSTYRVTSLLVHRDRPEVPRLDHLPVNQSYPSGHVAASVAVYAALALLISSWAGRRAVTVVAWTLAVLLVATVAFSRMERGMHHPIDVTAGALIGAGALGVALLAARAAGASEQRRRQDPP